MKSPYIQKKRLYDKSEIEFFYKPRSLTILFIGFAILLAFGFRDAGERDIGSSTREGMVAASVVFLVFAVCQLPNGAFSRPHPAVWRLVLGYSILYLLFLVFLFFQNVDDARQIIKHFDSSLGKELVLPLYAEDCRIYVPESPVMFPNVYDKVFDIFMLAHFFGWLVKALMIRDWKIMMIMSLLWECVELSLVELLPNFGECWWDQLILDFLLCNGLGMWAGMVIGEYLEMKEYDWVGYKAIPSVTGRFKRAALQFTPSSWTKVNWNLSLDLKRLFGGFALIVGISMVDLNAFLLKAILWVPSDNYLNFVRLFLWTTMGIPALREFYHFAVDKNIKKLGAQAYVCLMTMLFETAISIKFGRGAFGDAAVPPYVTYCWVGAFIVFIIYTIVYYPSDYKDLAVEAMATIAAVFSGDSLDDVNEDNTHKNSRTTTPRKSTRTLRASRSPGAAAGLSDDDGMTAGMSNGRGADDESGGESEGESEVAVSSARPPRPTRSSTRKKSTKSKKSNKSPKATAPRTTRRSSRRSATSESGDDGAPDTVRRSGRARRRSSRFVEEL